jgi:hypothetical protein
MLGVASTVAIGVAAALRTQPRLPTSGAMSGGRPSLVPSFLRSLTLPAPPPGPSHRLQPKLKSPLRARKDGVKIPKKSRKAGVSNGDRGVV